MSESTIEELEAIIKQLRDDLSRRGVIDSGPTIEDSDDRRIAAADAALKRQIEQDRELDALAAAGGLKPRALDATAVGDGTAQALFDEQQAVGWTEVFDASKRAAVNTATPIRVAGDARPECELPLPVAVSVPVPVVTKLPTDPIEFDYQVRFWAEVVREMGGYERVPEAYRKPVQDYFAARGVVA